MPFPKTYRLWTMVLNQQHCIILTLPIVLALPPGAEIVMPQSESRMHLFLDLAPQVFRSPLYSAASNGHLECLYVLLASGANVDCAMDMSDGFVITV